MHRVIVTLLLAPFLLATLSALPAQAQFIGNQDVKTIPPQNTGPRYYYGPNAYKHGQSPPTNSAQNNGAKAPPAQNPRPYASDSSNEPYKIGTNGNYGKYGNYGYLYGGKKHK